MKEDSKETFNYQKINNYGQNNSNIQKNNFMLDEPEDEIIKSNSSNNGK